MSTFVILLTKTTPKKTSTGDYYSFRHVGKYPQIPILCIVTELQKFYLANGSDHLSNKPDKGFKFPTSGKGEYAKLEVKKDDVYSKLLEAYYSSDYPKKSFKELDKPIEPRKQVEWEEYPVDGEEDDYIGAFIYKVGNGKE